MPWPLVRIEMAKILQSSLAAVLVIAVPVVASSSGLSSSPGTDKVGTKLAESPALRMLDNILIKHAVLTVFAWTFFVPLGAIVCGLISSLHYFSKFMRTSKCAGTSFT
jgi:hypothetical protein